MENSNCCCAEFSAKCPIHVGPYRVDGAAFKEYGDAQRYAWELLRKRVTIKASIGIVRTDGSIGTVEHWVIGVSGKYKWINAAIDEARLASGDATGRIVLS